MAEGKTILCVDDDDISRYLLKEFIHRIGDFHLVQLDSGQACINYMSQHFTDLIILDFNLGDMTGEQVCSEIPVKSLNPLVPVIIASIIDTSDVKQRLAGCSNLLKIAQKPYSMNELRADINQLFATDSAKSV